MRRIDIRPSAVCYVLVLVYFIPVRILTAFFLAAGVHELAHIAVLLTCRCRVERLIFGVADVQIEHGVLSPRGELICALVGPAVNVLCGWFFMRTAAEFAAASFLLGGFNLLPILPLDGGRMLRVALQMRLPFDRAERTAEHVGDICCAGIFLLAVFAVFRLQMGVWPMIAAVMLPIRLRWMEKGCFSTRSGIK